MDIKSIEQDIDVLDRLEHMISEHGLSESITNIISQDVVLSSYLDFSSKENCIQSIQNVKESLNDRKREGKQDQFTDTRKGFNKLKLTTKVDMTKEVEEQIAIAIGKFEKKHKIEFPPGYFTLVKNANGGVPDRTKITVDGKEVECNYFYEWVNKDPKKEPFEEHYTTLNTTLKKDKIIPFADSGSNSFCLDYDVGKEHPSVVYYYKHDNKVVDVAKTFGEFIHMLKK